MTQTFAAHGPLAQAEPGYHPREVQIRMAEAVAAAIADRAALVVEAGTGVGKTFAYLVPALLAGRRVLISTATKNLQDQLFFRDLPHVRKALNLPLQAALLKGRASYLCRHRLKMARAGAVLPDRLAVRALARIETWAQSTTSGDFGEVEGLDERSNVIGLVSSSRDNCLGGECPEFAACHVVKARREAMAADIVVINHHLFFADLALRDSGVAELLPTVDVAIFDEAHQMVEAGVQFLGQSLGTAQLLDFTRDLLAAGLQHARGLADWRVLAGACETAARDLRLVLAGQAPPARGTLKRRWDEVRRQPELAMRLDGVSEALAQVGHALTAQDDPAPDLARLRVRAQELRALCQVFRTDTQPDRVRWADIGPSHARLVDSPLDIREMMSEQRAAMRRAWIFTSATLGDDDALTWFGETAGLDDARKLRLGSPFDYASHARVYVPLRFAPPGEPQHSAMVGRAAAHCAAALGGRTFVLTTTLRAMHQVAQALNAELHALGQPLPVLVQGSASKRRLLEQFQAEPGVLVGSQSFWEGIDVAGDALQCVFIDKLPFPPPNDPLVESRVKQLKAQGRNAFNDYFVAEAAVSLKQGAGRLIRTETDRGLLVIGDTRLRQARYGARLLAALPPMTPLETGEQALQWLRQLAAGGAPKPDRRVV